MSPTNFRQFTLDDRLRDLLGHPAFAGFARLMLPWDDYDYDVAMKLRDVGAMLPYHSNVRPAEFVAAINRMVADVRDGRSIFYDFYNAAQKQAQAAKANAGLFFMRGKPGAPFALIAPGGGFSYVGSIHEGFPYAAEINRHGYNAFVLKYRVGFGGGVAAEDMAAALSYIVANADSLGIGAAGYSLWGSSAGARMAASIGSHGAARFGGSNLPKPATVVMAYTGHSDTAPREPPTFVVVGERDGIASPAAMERRLAALRNAGTEVEYHKYPNLGHGFGLGTGTSAEGWIDNAIGFWRKFTTAE
jgi:acetyl esterase/lipase